MADGAPSNIRESFRRSLTEPTKQHGFVPLRTTGRWPDGLSGTLYRNGPGTFVNFGHRYEHWFDGDGLFAGLRLDGRGAASGAVRSLESDGMRREKARGKAYYGGYGTRAPGFFNPLRMLRTMRGDGKNPTNTAVLAWNRRLFALCEAGKPLEVDPDTLASLGETDLGGAIPLRFSAHPHWRASDGSWINFGVRIGRPNAVDLTLLRSDGTAGLIGSFTLPFATMIHDFALTEKHAIVFVAPLHIALLPLLLGRKSFVDAHSWNASEPAEAFVIPLDAPKSVRRIQMPAFWAWHVANAFDDGERIVVDLIRHEDYRTSQAWLGTVLQPEKSLERFVPSGQLARVRLSPRSGSAETELLRHRTGEFPRVAPAVDGNRHRFVYLLEHPSPDAAVESTPTSIVRVDIESGVASSFDAAKEEFPSEPVFVPRTAHSKEGDGWVLSLVYDATRHLSYFAAFDAAHIDDGPIAKAYLETHVPMGFHGAFRS